MTDYSVEQNYSSQKFPDGIIKLMYDKGYIPHAYYETVHDHCEFKMGEVGKAIEYYEHEKMEADYPTQVLGREFKPALSLQQMWDYLNLYRIIYIDDNSYLLEGSIDFDSSESHVCIFYKTGSVLLEDSLIQGNLTDPSIPQNMLEYLFEKGLIK